MPTDLADLENPNKAALKVLCMIYLSQEERKVDRGDRSVEHTLLSSSTVTMKTELMSTLLAEPSTARRCGSTAARARRSWRQEHGGARGAGEFGG